MEEIVDEDRLLCVFDEHEESVYTAQWASNDPWLLASLSYDGRLILNRVPKNSKFFFVVRLKQNMCNRDKTVYFFVRAVCFFLLPKKKRE